MSQRYLARICTMTTTVGETRTRTHPPNPLRPTIVASNYSSRDCIFLGHFQNRFFHMSSLCSRTVRSVWPGQARILASRSIGSASSSFVVSSSIDHYRSPSLWSSSRATRLGEFPGTSQQLLVRHYTPMTQEEEQAEKKRVEGLSAFQKDQELRQLNREIARLEMFRNINTGELYTWKGRYKDLSRNYGMPFMMWYGVCWATTGILMYAAVEVGGIDAIPWIAWLDTYTGLDLASKVDPKLGKMGMALVMNEMIEPLRLPIVILTCKPVVDRIAPTKF